MQKERRRHRRYRLELPVRCRLVEPAGAPQPNLPGHTLDISEEGLAIVLPTLLAPGTDVTVLLDLPGGPVVAEATVVWAGPSADGQEGGYHGLKILEIAATHESHWQQFLARLASLAYSRRHGRLEIGLRVQCAVPTRPRRELEGRTVDLSLGGVQLRLPEAIPVGTRLQLSLQVPMGPHALEGEVVWCAPAGGGEHGVGVQFLQQSWDWSFLLDLAEEAGTGERGSPR